MPGAFAPRFAIEAGFLILLGVGAGYADLRPVVIVALLAGGWILVSLIELAVWRAQSRPAAGHAPPADEDVEDVEDVEDEEPEAAPEATVEPEVEDDYPLRPDAGDAPSEEVEEYTRVLSASPEERSTVQQGD
jgi:hypothetical protein